MTEALFHENLDLAFRIAHERQRRLPRNITDDVRSAAMIGLWQASQRWNEGPVPFRAFARIRIHGAITDTIRRLRWEPRGMVESIIDNDEAALDRPARECVEATVLKREELRQVIDRMNQLPARSRAIFRRHLRGDATEVIAADYSVSPSAISHIVKRSRMWLLREDETE